MAFTDAERYQSFRTRQETPACCRDKVHRGNSRNETIRRAVFFTDRFFYTSHRRVSRATPPYLGEQKRGATSASELVKPSHGGIRSTPYGPKTSFSARIPGRRLNIIIRGSRRPKARCLRRLSTAIVHRRTRRLYYPPRYFFFPPRFGRALLEFNLPATRTFGRECVPACTAHRELERVTRVTLLASFCVPTFFHSPFVSPASRTRACTPSTRKIYIYEQVEGERTKKRMERRRRKEYGNIHLCYPRRVKDSNESWQPVAPF